jgi:hypothetical protein
MPLISYLEVDGGGAKIHAKLGGDASDHTRYIRMAATIAPYINSGIGAAPTLGWRSQQANRDARVIAPIFGRLQTFIPNKG